MESCKDIVILKGSGKVFCAGGDIRQFSDKEPKNAAVGYKSNCEAFGLLTNYKKPYIVLINGLAMGGAAFYAVPGKYRVVTEKAVFSMPETAIGYFNDAGASYFLPRLDNHVGLYIGMTGARLQGFDLKKVKLATHYVDSSVIDDLEKKLLVCKSHQDVERILNDLSTIPLSSVTELDEITPKINKCFAGKTVEEIYENLQLDGSTWAKETIKTLNKMSPTSLKVTHRSITLGKHLSMKDCLEMEQRLVYNQILNSDLKEGVRALLVDKDLKPQWNPKTLSEVTEEHVTKFFLPMPKEDVEIISRLNNKL